MPAKWDGKCKSCHGTLTRGEWISYSKTTGAYHPRCATPPLGEYLEFHSDGTPFYKKKILPTDSPPSPERIDVPLPPGLDNTPPPNTNTGNDTPPDAKGTPPTLEEKHLRALTVAELRKEASARGIGTGTWRAGASEESLVGALMGRESPIEKKGPAPMPQENAPDGDSLARAIANAVEKHLHVKPEIEAEGEAKIREIVQSEIAARMPVKIEVKRANGETFTVDGAHERFPTLLQFVSERVHVFMVGPAGSGKTHAAAQCAETLGLRFSAMSVGPQTTLSHIFGYNDATGRYVRTRARDCYESGGVFLFDEIDSGSASVLTGINAMLANAHCAFPDGMVARHEDFICLAAGNTYGMGANRVYVGRSQLDAATLDRFAFLEFPTDEKLERAIAGDDTWVDYVQSLRKRAETLGIRHVISPRASINGAKMLRAGMDKNTILDSIVFKGIPADDRRKLEANA